MQQILLQVLQAIFPIRTNKWLGTSVFTVMSAGVEGKGKREMNWTTVLLLITNI